MLYIYTGIQITCKCRYYLDRIFIIQRLYTAICIQAQTANICARLFTFETGRLPLETELSPPQMLT